MPYKFWKLALADPSKIGEPPLEIHDGHPQPGFWRMKDADGGDMIPVAIWVNKAGEVVAKKGAEMVRHPDTVWTHCCRHPVREHVYRDFMAGKGWPDSPPPKRDVRKQTKEDAEKFVSETRGIGDNLPDDPFEALKLELDGEVEIAKELLSKPVKDQDAADKVANFAKRVSALGKKADEMFAVEKRPVLDQEKAIDDKWRDVRDVAKTIAKNLKRHLEVFLAEQRRIEQERQRKTAEEAEAKRRAAAEAERKAMQEARSAEEAEHMAKEAARLKEEAERTEREARERQVAAGRTGSKVSMRTFKTAKIVDYEKALLALKDHEKVREIVQIIANASARSDIAIPGTEIVTEERAV